MKLTLPSFAILRSGHAVILGADRHELDVLPTRLTSPLLTLVACSASHDQGYELVAADEDDRS